MEDGRHRGSSMSHPPPTGGSDRLYLLPASTYEAFRPVYDTLAGMGFYLFILNSLRCRTARTAGAVRMGTKRSRKATLGGRYPAHLSTRRSASIIFAITSCFRSSNCTCT